MGKWRTSSTTYYTDGKESAMSSDAKCIAFTRVFNFAATLFMTNK